MVQSLSVLIDDNYVHSLLKLMFGYVAYIYYNNTNNNNKLYVYTLCREEILSKGVYIVQ